MLTTIIIFVIVLGVLVFVHELGHFVVAKRMGVHVEEFGFGFPPRLFGIKRGDTLYSINALPLGGFVRIQGESGERSDDPHSFVNRKAWQKITILLAGVLMNFFLAYVLLTFGFMIGTPQVIDDSSATQQAARDISIVIYDVGKSSAADGAGIRPGDKLISINGTMFITPDNVTEFIQKNGGQSLQITVRRGNNDIVVSAKPATYENSSHPILGIGMVRTGLVSYGFFEALWQGARATVSLIFLVIVAFGQLLLNLVRGVGVSEQISGPVGVAVLTGQVAQLGFVYVINFAAMLSINLGILNAVPFPALDGGRVLFVIIEKIKGRPVSARLEQLFHNTGFVLLILLVLFVTYRDLIKYGAQIWYGISHLLS